MKKIIAPNIQNNLIYNLQHNNIFCNFNLAYILYKIKRFFANESYFCTKNVCF